MKVGLIDVDGHNFPNLALMKLSSFHKKRGEEVVLNPIGDFDLIYKSKVFSFTKEPSYLCWADKYEKGGTGFGELSKQLPDEIEHSFPDYSLYNIKDTAYGFFTRGCIRECSFCIVPQKEGKIKKHSLLEEFRRNEKQVILMDNNFLACEEAFSELEKCIDLKLKVDFNQGLDARIIKNNKDIVSLLKRVIWKPYFRMACDSDSVLDTVLSVIDQLNFPLNKVFIYCLIKDVEKDKQRIEQLRTKAQVFAMGFRDFTKNGEINPSLRDYCRYVNHKAIFNSIKWEEYSKEKK